MQETRVRSLIQEDPSCHRANKPVRHNHWACALEPGNHNYWAHVLQLPKSTRLEPVLPKKTLQQEACTPQLESRPCSSQLEKKPMQWRRSSTAKNKFFLKVTGSKRYYFKKKRKFLQSLAMQQATNRQLPSCSWLHERKTKKINCENEFKNFPRDLSVFLDHQVLRREEGEECLPGKFQTFKTQPNQ